ncbi:MAG: hypothetical protein AB7Q76_01480 [Gammaproteobacteria bacterium]
MGDSDDAGLVSMGPIYLDYNASTPIDPAVAAAMRPFLDEAFGKRLAVESRPDMQHATERKAEAV